MTRPLNKIVNFVSINVFHLRQITNEMSDEQLVVWVRKALNDLSLGCVCSDVDPVVKQAYDDSFNAMVKTQERKQAKYRAKKENQESAQNAVATIGATKRNDQLIYGRFENVFLSQNEYNELARDFGNINYLNQTIESFSASLADGTITSGNHFATLSRWIRYRQEKEQQANSNKYESVSEHNRRVYENGIRALEIMKKEGKI